MFFCNLKVILNSEDEFEAKEIEEFSSNADSLTVNILLKVIHAVRQITISSSENETDDFVYNPNSISTYSKYFVYL